MFNAPSTQSCQSKRFAIEGLQREAPPLCWTQSLAFIELPIKDKQRPAIDPDSMNKLIPGLILV